MRRGIFGGLGLIILAIIAFAAYFSLFIVDPTQQALVLRFGEVVRPVTQPGVYAKIPLIDNTVYFERRILDLDTSELEIIASDQKRLVVNAFGRYRIVNQLLFYQTVGNESVADQRLSVIVNSAVRRVLGEASFIELVRDKREELMERITEQVNREAQRLGIDMVDVKIRRADLPEANSQAIYHRMQTERQREAAEIRANGEQAARRIRAEADRDATVIVAEANRESEELRGDGDAKRNQIFADAYSRDPDFFAFYRSMLAYQAGLKPGDTRLLLSPDSDFFKYFANPNGTSSGSAASRPSP
jgi:membrane protease subunit HflC